VVQPPDHSADQSSDQPHPRPKDAFFYPIAKYRGDFSPQSLTFNANLQEFAQRVSLLCSLETSGKISPETTYKEIKQLWKSLKASKHNLLEKPGPSQSPPEDTNPSP
jgi:hypothetical protein